jgi:hypothetical protein
MHVMQTTMRCVCRSVRLDVMILVVAKACHSLGVRQLQGASAFQGLQLRHRSS